MFDTIVDGGDVCAKVPVSTASSLHSLGSDERVAWKSSSKIRTVMHSFLDISGETISKVIIVPAATGRSFSRRDSYEKVHSSCDCACFELTLMRDTNGDDVTQ